MTDNILSRNKVIFSYTSEREIRCKDPGQIKYGRKSSSRRTYRVGLEIRYRCLPGYEIDGTASLNCTGSGNWSNESPSCKRESSSLTLRGFVSHVEYHIVYTISKHIDLSIDYICLTYMFSAISCGKPPLINHGNFTGNEFTYHSVVTYKCDVGYKMIGKPQRRCRSNGKWTKKPKCQSMY
jgi:hypothetical protein